MDGQHPYHRAARAISALAARSASAPREAHYADVLSTDPLRVRRHDTGEVAIEGEDLVLGQWARTYDETIGIDADDTLVFHPMDDESIVIVEILSDNDVLV